MTDGCVLLLYNSSWKFHQPAAGQLLSVQPVRYGKDRRYSPSITFKITPAGSLPSSQPGGPPWWASPLAFGVIAQCSCPLMTPPPPGSWRGWGGGEGSKKGHERSFSFNNLSAFFNPRCLFFLLLREEVLEQVAFSVVKYTGIWIIKQCKALLIPQLSCTKVCYKKLQYKELVILFSTKLLLSLIAVLR